MQFRETRLKNQKEEIQEYFDDEDMGDITKLEPLNGKLDQWILQFKGRKGSLLYPGVYQVDIKIPESYPANFPDCKFRNGFQHYHVNQIGTICVICLPLIKQAGWSAKRTLRELAYMIVQKVHSDPILGECCDTPMDHLYKKDDGISYRNHLQKQAIRMKDIGKND